MTDLLIRPMRVEDVPVAEQVSADAFLQVDLARARPDEERPERRPAARRDDWIARTESLVRTDGPGCWVAERDGRVLGFATSLRREVLWALATRFQAGRDMFVIPEMICNRLDPSSRNGVSDKMGLDATRPATWDAERLSLPDAALERARAIASRA